jgi:hypothetical protein
VLVPDRTTRWFAHYVQTDDINAHSTLNWNNDAGWTPIGNEGHRFTGSYDGGGYTIDRLFINQPGINRVGLFGDVENGIIKNLGVTNVNITGGWSVATLAGQIAGGEISSSYATGSVIGSNTKTGGLVGRSVGGTLSESYFMGQVSGTDEVGGLVGENDNDGTISNSYTTGTVSGTGSDVGGLVGVNQSGDISDSYSTSEVNGNRLVGGLVGYFFNGTINRCYATNEVSGSVDGIGGLVGNIYSGSVNNSYATGTVSGNTQIGGLVGDNDGSVSNSFWDTDTSELSESAGGTGKTTEAMQNIATYNDSVTEGLDAEWPIVAGWVASNGNIWGICGGVNSSYPFLLWMFDENPCVYVVTPSVGPNGRMDPDTPQIVFSGETTSFTIIPDTGSSIALVTGCGGTLSGTTYNTGAITQDCTVNATFNVNSWTVTSTAGAGGNVDGGGTYSHGTTVTVQAFADTGYVFTHWTEGNTVVSCDARYSFRVTGDRTLRAIFSRVLRNYVVKGVASPANYGKIDGAGSYVHGASVTMTSRANQGFTLTNWIETWPDLAGFCVVSTEDQYSFTATRNRNLMANIRPQALPGTIMLLFDGE